MSWSWKLHIRKLNRTMRDQCSFRKRNGFYICPGLSRTEDRTQTLNSVRISQWNKLCSEVVQQTRIPTDTSNITCHSPSDLPSPVSGWASCMGTTDQLAQTGHLPLPSGANTGLGCGFCLSLKLSVSFAYWVATSPKLVGIQVPENAASSPWIWRVAKGSLHSPDRRTGETERLSSSSTKQAKYMLQVKSNST